MAGLPRTQLLYEFPKHLASSNRPLRIPGATYGAAGGQFISLSKYLSNSGTVLFGRSVPRPRERPLKPGPTILPPGHQGARRPQLPVPNRDPPERNHWEQRHHAYPLRLRERPLLRRPGDLAGPRCVGRGLKACRACARGRRRPASLLLKRVAGNCSGNPWCCCLPGGSACLLPWAWPWRCSSPESKASPCAGAPKSWPSSSVSPRAGRRAGRTEPRPPGRPAARLLRRGEAEWAGAAPNPSPLSPGLLPGLGRGGCRRLLRTRC